MCVVSTYMVGGLWSIGLGHGGVPVLAAMVHLRLRLGIGLGAHCHRHSGHNLGEKVQGEFQSRGRYESTTADTAFRFNMIPRCHRHERW